MRMKKCIFNLHYLMLFLFIILFSCENKLLNETSISTTENEKTLVGIKEAIAFFEQFRNELVVSPNTRSNSDVKILSTSSKTYQIQLSENGNKSISTSPDELDTIDIYTIIFEKEGKKGFSILSPDTRVGRIYAYTENGSLNDTITNKGLALHLSEISNICKSDLISYYNGRGNKVSTRASERKLMIPNFMNYTWGQGEPFNALCPKLCNGKPALAGSAATAFAEAIMYFKSKDLPPSGDTYSNTSIDYSLLANYPQISSGSPENVKNEVAKLIFDIGNRMGAHWGCGGFADDTNIDLNMADKVFGPYLNLLFKEQAPKRQSVLEYYESNVAFFDKNKITNSLFRRIPIIVQGMSNYAPARHVWLYTGVKYVEIDYQTARIDEFYISWGENGRSDGWYAFNNNLGFVPYELLFLYEYNPDGESGGGMIQ